MKKATEISQITDKDQKLGENWLKNIETRLRNFDPSLDSAENLLARYAKEKNGRGKIILAHVLNKNIFTNPSETEKNIKCTLLYLATRIAMLHPDINHRKHAREVIAVLLAYGSEAHLHQPSPVFVLFAETDSNAQYRIRHQYAEILKPFLEYPENLNLRGPVHFTTLAHISAKYACGSLALVLAKRPDLLETTQKSAATPLFTAVQYNQLENVKALVTQYKANFQHLNDQGCRTISLAMQLGFVEIVKFLLEQGSSIEPKISVCIQSSREMQNVLTEAGYYLSMQHLLSFANDRGVPVTLPFFTIRDKLTQERKLILSPEDLRTCKLQPSDQQITRLHQSFQEELLYSKSIYLEQLYAAFRDKFPILNQKISVASNASINNDYVYTIFQLGAVLQTASNNPGNTTQIAYYHKIVHEIFASTDVKTLKEFELLDMMQKLVSTINPITQKILSEKEDELPFAYFASKVMYLFSLKILPFFIEMIKEENLVKFYSHLYIIPLLACRHINNSHKSRLNIIEALEFMVHQYTRPNIPAMYAQQLTLLKYIQEIFYYADNGFYEELIDIIKQAGRINAAFAKNEISSGLIDNLLIALSSCVINTNISTESLENKIRLLDCIEAFCDDFVDKRPDQKKNCELVLRECHIKRKEVADHYKNFAAELKKHASTVYTFGDHNERTLKITFNHSDELPINPAAVRNIMRVLHPKIEWTETGYYIKLLGYTFDEIEQTLNAINKITYEDIQHKPVSPSSANELPAPSEGSSSSYINQDGIKPKQNTVKKEKGKQKTQNPQAPAPENKILFAEKTHQIKLEIKQALNLKDDAEVFHIEHPGFPEKRRHLSFGLWSNITGKNVTNIPKEAIQSHHDLALTGKVVTFRYGQPGLKPTQVIDAQTGKYLEGLKTKTFKKDIGDIRINGIPVKVNLKKEIAVLYVFGVASDHKQEIPKINAPEIISVSCKK